MNDTRREQYMDLCFFNQAGYWPYSEAPAWVIELGDQYGAAPSSSFVAIKAYEGYIEYLEEQLVKTKEPK